MKGKLICCCNKAKKDCENICIKWIDKDKPNLVYNIPTWPKISIKK